MLSTWVVCIRSEYLVAVIDNCIDVVQNLGIECANATSQSSQAKYTSSHCQIDACSEAKLSGTCDMAFMWPG